MTSNDCGKIENKISPKDYIRGKIEHRHMLRELCVKRILNEPDEFSLAEALAIDNNILLNEILDRMEENYA